MKLYTYILALLLTMLSLQAPLQAQCPFNNTFYVDLTPSGPGATATDACVWGGDLVTVNVVSGDTYVISLCANAGFDDSQITLYDAAGTTVLGFNDDFCGLYSEITYVATYTGVLNVVVDEFNCVSATSCMQLDVTRLGPCNADAGTQTISVNGSAATSPLYLCKGDCLDVLTDSNFVLPPPVTGEAAELMYAFYTDTPNVAIEPNLDPNFSGLFWTGDQFSDCNTPASIVLGAGLGNHIWMVPITMDDGDDNSNPNAAINYDNNSDSCFALGTPIEVFYLDSITATITENCATNVTTFVLTGGFPNASAGGSYLVTNTGAGTLSQSGSQGEIITLSGYTVGQTLSFNVTNDGNGCATTISYVTSCAPCAANVGTFTIDMSNGSANNYVLCAGDSISINSNQNYVLPPTPDVAGVGFAIYACTPTTGNPDTDPCWTGYYWTGDTISDINNQGATLYDFVLNNPIAGFATASGNSLCFVPITMDDIATTTSGGLDDNLGHDIDLDGCYVEGTPICVTYLAPITANSTETCVNGTPSMIVTLDGGYPATEPTAGYQVTNTGAGTLSQFNTQGDSIVITGYTAGQTVSFDVVSDSNSCTFTFSTTANFSQPTLTLDSIHNVSCNSNTDGAVFVTGTATNANACNITIDMFDSFGDGWNGGNLGVTINGTPATGSPFAATGAGSSVSFTAPPGATVAFNYTAGAFENENTYNIIIDGILVFSDGPTPTTGNVFTFNCPTPAAPSYQWNNSAITEDITGLGAGTYSVTLTDAFGCTATSGPHNVTEPSPLAVVVDSTQLTGCTANTGAIFVTSSGGTTSYNYNWSNSTTAEDAINLAAGPYSVTVTDANGCTASASSNVTQAASPTVAAAITSNYNGEDVSCNGATDGQATASPSAGQSPYTYNWSNGQTNATATGLGVGAYTITLTDNNGCTATDNISLTGPTAVTIAVDSSQNSNCSGGGGAVFVTANGGTGAYTYNWSNSATTEDITGLASGSYTVTVADANGCTSTASTNIATQGAATISFTTTNVSCNGANDGCIVANVTGATGNLGYLWSNGATTDSICGLNGGTYTVTVTDTISAGSSGSLTALYSEAFDGVHNWTLNVPTGVNGADNNFWQVDSDEAGMPVGQCGSAGGTNRSLHITSVFNPAGGAAYDAGGLCGLLFCPETNMRAESPAFSTVGQSNLSLEFNYIAKGDTTLPLNDDASIYYNAGTGWTLLQDSLKSSRCGTGQGLWTKYNIALPAACDNNPSVQIGFNWTNNDDAVGTDPSVAIDSVVVFSNNSSPAQICTIINDTTITEPAAITITVDSTSDANCGATDGTVFITAAGGTGGLTYNWSNGATTDDITGLSPNSYTVTITDNSGCSITNMTTISNTGGVSVTLDSVVNVACNGDSTGAIFISDSLTPSPCASPTVVINEVMYRPTNQNGQNPNTGEYIELLGPPGLDISCYVLTDGDWTITFPSGSIIPADGIFTIGNDIVHGAGTFDLDAENCGCFTDGGGGSGLLILTDGGEYVALFDDTGAFLEGMVYGTPTVGFNDPPNGTATTGGVINTIGTAGCPSSVTIPGPAVFQNAPGGVSSNAALSRNPDGSGSFVAQAGGSVNACNFATTPTATYTWSNGDTTQDVTGLGAGVYTVTVSDGACSTVETYTVTEPSPIVAAVDSTMNPSCNGGNDGAVYITASGGTGTLTYNWSNGATTEDIMNLTAGTYCATVTDNNGCTENVCATITEPSAISLVTDNVTSESCGAGDGAIATTANGGTGMYNYNWSNGATTDDITGLTTGNYNVTITDSLGCTYTDAIFVGATGGVAISLDSTVDVSCNGNANGAVFITDSAAAGVTVTYSWSNGSTTQDITGLSAGIYLVTATDTSSCITTGSYTITEPSIINLIVDTVINVNCNGDATGTITVSSTGGAGGFTYNWSNGAASASATGLTAGNYCITVTNANGCTASVCDSITEPTALTASLVSSQNPFCNGESSGTIDINVSGGAGGYSYNWTNGSTTQNLANIPAGNYTVTVTDGNGCTTTTGATLTDPAALVLNISTTDVSCGGSNDGSATVTSVQNGATPFSYLWNPGGQTGATISNLSAGTYSVTVTDNNGCTASTTGITIQASTGIDSADVPIQVVAGMLDCDLNPIGHLSINTTGSYTYAWSDGQTTQDATGLTDGSYTVTITDGSGCTITQSAMVVAPFVPNINPFVTIAGMTADSIAVGDSTTVSGGNDQSGNGVTYQWSGPADVMFGDMFAHMTNISSSTAGSYTLSLTATAGDSVACTDTGSVVLFVTENFQGIPTAFTPNDDGVNDLFRPIGLEADDIIEFRIYNRFGQLVYNGDNLPNDGWDGTTNGVPQPREAYIYLLRYQLGGQEPQTIKGEVFLLR